MEEPTERKPCPSTQWWQLWRMSKMALKVRERQLECTICQLSCWGGGYRTSIVRLLIGPQHDFDKGKEQVLADYWIKMSDIGIGLGREDIMRMAFAIIEKSGRPYPFKNSMAGQGGLWEVPKALTARASITLCGPCPCWHKWSHKSLLWETRRNIVSLEPPLETYVGYWHYSCWQLGTGYHWDGPKELRLRYSVC